MSNAYLGAEQPGETVADALARVLCERDHLRRQRDELQAANTRLVQERRATLQSQVRSFFAAVGQRQPEAPGVPPGPVVRLRAKLIVEEALEFIASVVDLGNESTTKALQRAETTLMGIADTAPLNVDLVEYADAAADVLFVAAGAFIDAGIDGDAVVAEVTRSNLTKAGAGRDESGKARKGAGYSPPDIADVLREQGWTV